MTKKTNREAIEPQFRVETRISYVAWEQGIKVPLGEYWNGKWCPYGLVQSEEDSGLMLTPRELSNWLAEANSFEIPFIDSEEEAEKAVRETIQRCRALAEAVRQEKVERPGRVAP